MTFQKEVEEFKRYRHAYALAFSAAMGSIFYGWDIGLIGGVIAMKSFKEYFGVDKMSKSAQDDLSGNIVSVLQAGCFFGALFTGYFSGKFGRKPSLIAAGVIYIIGSLIQSVVGLGSSEKVGLRVLYFSRFLGGIGVGMVSALVPSYVSESVPKAIRGRCTGMIQLCNNMGIMLAFWVNYSASKNIAFGDMQWRIPFIVQMVPGAIFLLLIVFQPESPRWLVEHEKYDRAAKALAFAAGTSPDDPSVQETLREIQEEFAGKAKTSIWTQIAMMGESRTTVLRSFVPSLVMFFQQWTGTNTINYFSPTIFANLGVTGQNSGLFATGIYGVVKVVSVAIVLAFAVESMGRKKCLIIGGIGQGVMMLWIAGYSAIHTGSGVDGASYVSIVAVYFYAIFYCVGWGPVPWVVAGEVAPNHVRTAAMAVAIGVNWLFSFIISKITPIMLSNITYGTFLIFGLMCMIMAAWAWLCLPETSGYALEDIKFLFEHDMLVRALEDAPGGRFFLGSKRSVPVADLRRAEDEANRNSYDPESKDEQPEHLERSRDAAEAV
ncbi:general substrate transporter [Punctularia strigosozonata HHB-11173 SS5]|uniref:general substrate transporter n=1 Tax=Punctularia strigosozonata (strain HHB-11173) TaxID=741275 RepID=UPI00044169BE|nr:general substrate transporter [Punctularia strigosozonata HHB-11173 SS5]EIN09868.1 general substrate transporter [Punctularia strigosozonata HHB-11173 SS5]